MRSLLLFCAVLLGAGLNTAGAAEPLKPEENTAKFELKEGDRVVFLGNTLIERLNSYGNWEIALSMLRPELNVTFRNLGWSGDTVWGESRAGFGRPADGFKALVDQVNAAKPTVIFVGYGNVEAFAGEAGLPKFVEGFNQLLDVLEATKARIVVLGPVIQVPGIVPLAVSEAYNKNVVWYSAKMKSIAEKRGHRFVDFVTFEHFESPASTTNGVDRTFDGYSDLTPSLIRQIGYKPSSLEAVFRTLGIVELDQAIRKKNQLFFYRWRPQNETYLFGFRKHEQGKNGAEVFQFDPLVEAEEKKIAELRVKLAAELKQGGAK